MKKKFAKLVVLVFVLGLIGWGIYATITAPRHQAPLEMSAINN